MDRWGIGSAFDTRGTRRAPTTGACWSTKILTGFFPLEAYQDVGFSAAQIDEARNYRRDVAARNDYAQFRKFFRRDMHNSLIGNLVRIGLLTDRVRPRLAELGVRL